MSESQAELMTRIFELTRNLQTMDSVEAANALSATGDVAAATVKKIEEMPPFHTDTMLRFATLGVVRAYEDVIRTDLQHMASLVTAGQLTDSTGQQQARTIRRSILKKLMTAEKEFARQEGNFRRNFLAGKDFIESDTTFFSSDTANQSDF